MIAGNNITKTYSGRRVLDIKELYIEKGERVALTGANGSGKSTLLKILAGAIKSDTGTLEVKGTVLYMPQRILPFDMSVLKNVTYSLKGNKKENEEKAMEALKKTGLCHLYNKNALSLSGGEAARLSLARILVRECDILLLDEPTGAVDVEGTLIIEKALEDYACECKCSLIAATHSPLQAKRLADRVIMLEKGFVAEDTSPEKLLKSPSTDFGKKFVDMWRY